MTRNKTYGFTAVLFSAGLLGFTAPTFAENYSALGYYPSASPSSYSQPSYTAHEACKRAEDRRQVVSGAIGAVAGGVIGSQMSGSGARTEGSAIGAVIGGLAGAGIADTTIDCDPVYSSQVGYSSKAGYPSTPSIGQASYPTSGAVTYPVSTIPASSYPVQPTQQYPDQVTYSNHPVYSNPTYGTGAVTYGTTYPANTVSYPPAPVISQPASSYGNSYSGVTTYQAAYVAPHPRPRRMRRAARGQAPHGAAYYPSASYSGSHYHDRFACTDRH